MDLKSLSSNWKRLKQQLDKDKPLKKRKASSVEKDSSSSSRKKMKLAVSKSLPDASRQVPQKPVDLELWAVENDISAVDLREAYGTIRKRGPSVPTINLDKINEGLSTTAEMGKYIALDCEMVGVGRSPPNDTNALARISIVNYHGTQVYDSFVRPQEPVTDWRTHISGVSPRHMSTARDFVTVQADVAELLEGKILVGHALRNDLDALKLSHPMRDTRDTARYREFRKLSAGRTPGLKRLASEVLGVDIQNGEHSSVEDARATMLLFRRVKDQFEAEHARRFPSSIPSRPQVAQAAAAGSESPGEGKPDEKKRAATAAQNRRNRLKKRNTKRK
ncbi:MAG: 3'-5' exonuclease [Geoglossum umbratile]|nr:MAG: 3'-5' exonuclease [Geoglossum umbratile]